MPCKVVAVVRKWVRAPEVVKEHKYCHDIVRMGLEDEKSFEYKLRSNSHNDSKTVDNVYI